MLGPVTRKIYVFIPHPYGVIINRSSVSWIVFIDIIQSFFKKLNGYSSVIV